MVQTAQDLAELMNNSESVPEEITRQQANTSRNKFIRSSAGRSALFTEAAEISHVGYKGDNKIVRCK